MYHVIVTTSAPLGTVEFDIADESTEPMLTAETSTQAGQGVLRYRDSAGWIRSFNWDHIVQVAFRRIPDKETP